MAQCSKCDKKAVAEDRGILFCAKHMVEAMKERDPSIYQEKS